MKKLYRDKEGIERVGEFSVWNPTIANLTLMALGSSAPEIMLSVIETLLTLGSVPGELGPSTIVGSAAFNLLVISAVSIAAVPTGSLKKIDDLGVFAITASASLFAYIWMFVCLQIWTPGEISVWEGVLTFGFFIILIVAAYGADRVNARRLKKRGGGGEPTPQFKIEDFYRVLHATKHAGPGETSTSRPKHEALQQYLRETFNKELHEIDPEEVKELLKPKSVVADRIHARKAVATSNSGTGYPKLVVTKGMRYKKEEKLASETLEESE